MQISLVSINHHKDPGAEIPFIGGRCPQVEIKVETKQARLIAEVGFDVEFVQEVYDPIAAQAKRAAKLAAALEKGQPPKVAAPAQAVEEVQPAAPVSEEQQEAGDTAEGETISEEELKALRERVVALDSVAKAKALVTEYGIELDASVTKLKDIKAGLLVMIDGQ